MQLEIGTRYSFDVYASAFIDNVENGTVISVVSGIFAEQLGHQVATVHRQVFPELPKETAKESFKDQLYYLIEYDNGNVQAIGEQWIKRATVRVVSRQDVNVTFLRVDPDMLSILPEIFDSHGLSYRFN